VPSLGIRNCQNSSKIKYENHIRSRWKIDTPITHIQYRSFSWPGLGKQQDKCF
jgi:hypothetical protein